MKIRIKNTTKILINNTKKGEKRTGKIEIKTKKGNDKGENRRSS
jgi:hypothetical protein